jgi:ATP-dependent DNA helicase RecG
MVEMYADRVEVTNPGVPPISVECFIDEYRSRNERLADLMRQAGASRHVIEFLAVLLAQS